MTERDFVVKPVLEILPGWELADGTPVGRVPEAERVGQVQQDTWLHDFIGGKKAVQRQRNTAVLRFCMGKCGLRRLLKRIVERSQ